MRDFLARTHQALYLYLPALVFLPVVFFLSWRAVSDLGGTALVWGAVGIFLWTFIEYVLHRFAFHYDATSEFGKKIVLFSHGYHHLSPDTTRRAIMTMSVPGALLVFGFFRLFFSTSVSSMLFGGVMVGYLAYDAIHYILHHWKFHGRLGLFLKKYHFRHHHEGEKRGFGVTTPFWDYVFRTGFSD